MSELLFVRLDETASPAEVDAVREVLDSNGLRADVRPDWQRPPPEPETGNGIVWMIIIGLGIPVGAFLKAFGQRLGERAAEDAYNDFKGFAKRLFGARRASPFPHGAVQLEDPAGTTVVITDRDGDEPLEKLQEVDLAEYAGETLLWDGREWFSYERRFGGKS